MFSNSQAIFDQLSNTVLRAATYLSYADIEPNQKDLKLELESLNYLMLVLKKEHSEDSFVHDLAKLAKGGLDTAGDFSPLTDKEIKEIQAELENTPDELRQTAKIVLENFSKKEARLYFDIVMAAASSVAQAFDEKDDINFVNGPLGVLANPKQYYYRFLMIFRKIHETEHDKMLYDESDIFDQFKISTKESDALGHLTSAIGQAWFEKYPEDKEQTVQEYIKEHGEDTKLY